MAWYTPRFKARSLVLARQHEYQADKISSQVVSAQTAAQALQAFNISAYITHQGFWEDLWSKSSDQAQAPQQIYAAQQAWVKQNWLDTDEQQALFETLLEQNTDLTDTHPALRDRISALGQTTQPIPAPQQSAAEAIFGANLSQAQALLDTDWHQQADHIWQQQYQAAQQIKQREQELQALSDPTNEQLIELGTLQIQIRDDNSAALHYFDRVLRNEPQHGQALYLAGICRLNLDDTTGIEQLKQAVQLNPQLAKHCYENLANYYHNNNDQAQAEHYKQKYYQYQQQEQAEESERRSVKLSDNLSSPIAPQGALESIQAKLKQYPEITEAYLIRKQMPFDPTQYEHYLIIIPKAKNIFSKRSSQDDQQLTHQLFQQLDGIWPDLRM